MTAMRLGFWPPVYGNWIMTDSPDQGVASYEYVKERAHKHGRTIRDDE